MEKRKRRQLASRILLALLLLGSLGLIVLGFLPKPVPVTVGEVTRGPIAVTVEESGRTRIRSPYVLSAPVFGNVSRITLRPGDPVEAGEVLAQIAPVASALLDPRSRAEAMGRVAVAEANVARARTAVQRAEAALSFAGEQAERLRRLHQAQGTSQQALDQAEFELRTAQEEHRGARLGLRVAENELALARAAAAVQNPSAGGSPPIPISAPIAGRVLRVFQQSETVVQPGTPLIEIGDPSALEVVVDVLTTEAVEIQRGDKAVIERWGGPTPLSAVVRAKEPSAFTTRSALGVEEQRVAVVLDLTDPYEEWRELSDGYRVEAVIITDRIDNAVRAPAAAVFRDGDAWSAFLLRAGRAQKVALKLGIRTPDVVEVRAGLAPGDKLALYPSDQVQDGVEVTTMAD